MKAYFSREIQSVLNLALDKATHSVTIAVAWFTDKVLFEAVLECLQRGVKVEMYVRNDFRNNHSKALNWQNYIDFGGILYFDAFQKLHHKFCIIDSKDIYMGSYNWTLFAHMNSFESIIHIESENVTQSFLTEFKKLVSKINLVERNVRLLEADFTNQEIIFFKNEIQEEANFEENTALGTEWRHLLYEAIQQYQHKNYDVAENLLNEINLIQPNESKVHIELAHIFWRKCEYVKQFDSAKTALDLSKDDDQKAQALNCMGLSQIETKNYPQAVNFFKQANKINSSDFIILWNKYLSEDKLGHKKESDNTALEVIKVCSETIRRLKISIPCTELLKARIIYAKMSIDKTDAKNRAMLAKGLFYQLTEEQRDYHDLDDIEELLKTNP